MRGAGWARALTIAALFAAGTAWADGPVVGGEGFFTFDTYSMKQVNDRFDAAAAGFEGFDSISRQIAGGFGVRFWLNDRWLLTAAWEPLFGETHGMLTGVDSTAASYTVDVRYNVDANSIQLGGAYMIPSSSPLRLGLGAGLGYYWMRGVSVLNHQSGGAVENFQRTDHLRGGNLGFQVAGVGELMVRPSWSLTAMVGYRLAKLGDTRINGASTNPPTETDYSGLLGRLGVALYLPARR